MFSNSLSWYSKHPSEPLFTVEAVTGADERASLNLEYVEVKHERTALVATPTKRNPSY
jgi:hypothetical protein